MCLLALRRGHHHIGASLVLSTNSKSVLAARHIVQVAFNPVEVKCAAGVCTDARSTLCIVFNSPDSVPSTEGLVEAVVSTDRRCPPGWAVYWAIHNEVVKRHRGAS